MEMTWHKGILGNVGILGKDREKEKSHHPCQETNQAEKKKVLIQFKSLNIIITTTMIIMLTIVSVFRPLIKKSKAQFKVLSMHLRIISNASQYDFQ